MNPLKPRIVEGIERIARELDLDGQVKLVKRLIRGGMPVRVLGDGRQRRYVCELNGVLHWFRTGRAEVA